VATPELDDEDAGEVRGLDLASLSRHRCTSALSSSPMMVRASEPPMKLRLFAKSAIISLCTFIVVFSRVRQATHTSRRYVPKSLRCNDTMQNRILQLKSER